MKWSVSEQRVLAARRLRLMDRFNYGGINERRDWTVTLYNKRVCVQGREASASAA